MHDNGSAGAATASRRECYLAPTRAGSQPRRRAHGFIRRPGAARMLHWLPNSPACKYLPLQPAPEPAGGGVRAPWRARGRHVAQPARTFRLGESARRKCESAVGAARTLVYNDNESRLIRARKRRQTRASGQRRTTIIAVLFARAASLTLWPGARMQMAAPAMGAGIGAHFCRLKTICRAASAATRAPTHHEPPKLLSVF